jgi:NAD-dependent SIR2 family protein deacetylase
MKTCSKCKEELDESAFGERTASKDGLFPWCRDCVAETNRKRYVEQRKAGGVVVKPMSVAIKEAKRQKRIVQYGIDIVEVLDTLE